MGDDLAASNVNRMYSLQRGDLRLRPIPLRDRFAGPMAQRSLSVLSQVDGPSGSARACRTALGTGLGPHQALLERRTALRMIDGVLTLYRRIGLIAILGVILSACATATPSAPVSEDDARAMAEDMLAAYNDGDYERWSEDWSQEMKDAIGPDAFQAFRDETMAGAGAFEQIDSVESRPGNNPGVTRFEFVTQFENGPMAFMIAFDEGDELIDGVDLRPVSE
jgi:Protein of unknown function (DUF3887)